MDTFFEQIVAIKRTALSFVYTALIWIAGLIVAAAALFLAAMYGLAIIGAAAAVGIVYLCIVLSRNFSIEYEYIFTNGSLDIDKIIAKQKRQRIITISCETVERVSRFKPDLLSDARYKKKIVACDPDENSCCIAAKHSKAGNVLLVFAPEERMLSEMSKFIPRVIMREIQK